MGLAEAGLHADSAELIIGTSCGGFVGAGVRLGRSLPDIASLADVAAPGDSAGRSDGVDDRDVAAASAHTTRAWRSNLELARRVVGASGVLASSVVGVPLGMPKARTARLFPGGLYTLTGAARLRHEIGSAWPAKPLWLVAIDVHTRRRVTLGRDPAHHDLAFDRALLATSAVPALYEPVRLNGRYYVDGGLRTSTNLDLALRTGAERIVCIAPLGYTGTARLSVRQQALRRQTMRRMVDDVAAARRRGVELLYLAPTDAELEAMGNNPLRASGNDVVAANAARATRRALDTTATARFVSSCVSS